MAGFPTKQSSFRRWLVRILVILGSIGGVALLVALRPQKVMNVRATAVVLGTVRDVVTSSAAGDILAGHPAIVRAQANGQILEVLKKIGERVTKGEIIIRIDAQDQTAQLSQAHASVRSAYAQISQSQARVDTLLKQKERANQLAQNGGGTVQSAEDAERALTEAVAAKSVATAQSKQMQAAQRSARSAYEKTVLRAPFDGMLTHMPVHTGDCITPSQEMFQLIDDQRLYLEATLDEADTSKVKLNQEAELRLDAFPDLKIAGYVSRIDPVLKKDLKGARTLLIEVDVTDLPNAKTLGLKAGMSANVDVLVGQKDRVLFVPRNAIEGRGINRFVYVLQPEGKGLYRIKKTSVSVGLSNWEVSEILATGVDAYQVKAGDLVVASLNDKGLEEGALVRITKEEGGAKP